MQFGTMVTDSLCSVSQVLYDTSELMKEIGYEFFKTHPSEDCSLFETSAATNALSSQCNQVNL